jgi:hypothetical protein
MNGQRRDSYDPSDYSKINFVKQVEKFENHRGYKLILYIRPFYDTHMGYIMDNDAFFGFKHPNPKSMLESLEAIDYYLDKVPEIFRNPSLEYDMFSSKELFKPYLNALNFVRDESKKK